MIRSLPAASSPLAPLLLCLSVSACSGGGLGDDNPEDPPLLGAAVLGATQDRDLDPSGATLIVEFDGAMNTADVETASHYSVPGATILSASQLTPTTVQVTISAAVIPGETPLTIQAGMRDANGEPSAGASAQSITSTDEDPPRAARIAGVTVSGLNNDQATIEFDDLMVATDVERVDSWNLESPIGVPIDLSRAVVAYDEAEHAATITLGGGQNLATGEQISAVLTTMRDVGGNTIESSAFGAGAVTAFVVGDTTAPRLLSAYPGETANSLRLIFDEPVQFVETPDLIASQPISGTDVTFAEASAPGVPLVPVSSTSILAGLGAELTFSVAPEAGDTATVAGIADLAGNVMLPIANFTIDARDPAGPGLFVGSTELIAVEGERNDIFRMTFDRALHPDGLFYDYRYGLLAGFFVNTLGAKPSWDGDREVTFLLRGPIDHEVQTANTYLLAVAQIMSRQGVPVDATTYEYTVTPTGDSTPPTLTSARTVAGTAGRLLVEYSEALQVDVATDVQYYDLNGSAPTAAELLSPRIVALTFAQPPGLGETLTVTTSALRDRAGNRAPAHANVAVQGPEATAPTVTGLVATAVDGAEGDVIVAQFSELIHPLAVADGTTLSLTVNGSTVTLEGAVLIYQSATNTLTAELPESIQLPFGEVVTLEVDRLVDPSGNVTTSASMNATVTGDNTPPASLSAFVNYREDAGRTVVEVTPNEALRASASGVGAWSSSGGQAIVGVSALGLDRFRVSLSAPLGAADTLTLTNATDLAGNVAPGLLVIDPDE